MFFRGTMSVLRFLEQDMPLSHYDPAQQVVLLYIAATASYICFHKRFFVKRTP